MKHRAMKKRFRRYVCPVCGGIDGAFRVARRKDEMRRPTCAMRCYNCGALSVLQGRRLTVDYRPEDPAEHRQDLADGLCWQVFSKPYAAHFARIGLEARERRPSP